MPSWNRDRLKSPCGSAELVYKCQAFAVRSSKQGKLPPDLYAAASHVLAAACAVYAIGRNHACAQAANTRHARLIYRQVIHTDNAGAHPGLRRSSC